MFRLKFYAAVFALVICLLATFNQTAQAATVTVTNAAGAGAGSLRQAVINAASGDTIVFAAPLFDTPQTIEFISSIIIEKNLTIMGRAANLLTIRVRAADSPVFFINSFENCCAVTLSGMTITGGHTTSTSDGVGGGIQNFGSTLTLRSVHVAGNTAGTAGGIFNNFGTLNIINSTISNNIANRPGDAGGGIDNRSGTLTITNSTISGNIAAEGVFCGGGILSSGNDSSVTITNSTITNNIASEVSGGGVFKRGGTVTIRNTIIAANNFFIPDTPDVEAVNPDGSRGIFLSNGYNLIGNAPAGLGFTGGANNDQVGNSTTHINPLVFPLGNSDSGVPIHALRLFPVASPAIDKGSAAAGVTTDQRGLTRPFDIPSIPNVTGGDGSDIGAFEVQVSPTAASVSVSGRVLTISGRGLTNAAVTMTSASGNRRTTRTSTFGNFRFNEVEAGQTYIFNVVSKRYRFAPQIVTVMEDLTELNFTPQSELGVSAIR